MTAGAPSASKVHSQPHSSSAGTASTPNASGPGSKRETAAPTAGRRTSGASEFTAGSAGGDTSLVGDN